MKLPNNFLKDANEVLLDLERGLEKESTIFKELRKLNPGWEQLSKYFRLSIVNTELTVEFIQNKRG